MLKDFRIIIGHKTSAAVDSAVQRLEAVYDIAYYSKGPDILNHVLQDRPDLAILDYSVDEVDVIALCEKLSGDFPDVNTVIAVTIDQLEVAKKKWRKRALDYIIMPLDSKEFVEEINKIVRYVLVEREREKLIRNKIELRYHLNKNLADIKESLGVALKEKEWSSIESILSDIEDLEDVIQDLDTLA